jgi:hypothetical protein
MQPAGAGRRICRSAIRPNATAPPPISTLSSENAPATQPPQPSAEPATPKQGTSTETRIEPIPAISEPIARPDTAGATRTCSRPYSVPATGSTRDGCHCPSGGGGGTGAAAYGGPGGGAVIPSSLSPVRDRAQPGGRPRSGQSVSVSKSCPGVPATCSSPAIEATTSAVSARMMPAQASRRPRRIQAEPVR